MSKTGGLGDNAYVGGYDLSGNIMVLNSARGGPAALDFTDISQSGMARLGGERDAEFSFTTAMDPAALQEHAALSPLPTADVIATYFRGQALGNPAYSINSKQVNYDPTRGQDGSLPFSVQCLANSFGAEWGLQLTPGKRTDGSATAAGPGNSIDTLASASFGGQAYLHVFSVVGTSVTIVINDSADNSSFSPVAGFSFSAVTPGGAPNAQRSAISNVSTIRRYIAVQTTGTFTSAVFAVMINKNPIAGVVF
jgi:hypothetical protein